MFVYIGGWGRAERAGGGGGAREQGGGGGNKKKKETCAQGGGGGGINLLFWEALYKLLLYIFIYYILFVLWILCFQHSDYKINYI
jgi:hypothetical protein